MSYFENSAEVQGELEAFLTDFVNSDEGIRAAQAAATSEHGGVLVLRTINPASVVSLDIPRRLVAGEVTFDAVVELEFEADDLHDILLNRLGPVEISQLYETDCVGFAGRPEALGAVAILAGQAQPFYPDSLTRRGRQDLLSTPARPVGVTWQVSGPPKEIIGKRRPWQREKQTAASV